MPRKGQFKNYCKRGHKRTDRGVCKLCKPLLEKRYWEKNKVKIREKQRKFKADNPGYDKEYQRRIRLEVLEHYGGKCACCGISDYEFLAFDHIKGGGTKHRREQGLSGGKFAFWLRKNGYPEGYRVLCHNCNIALGMYGYCPHHNLETQLKNPIVEILEKNNPKFELPKIESLILGFGFRARSGKDTAVAEIVKQRRHAGYDIKPTDPGYPMRGIGYTDGIERYDVRAYSFARALKEEVTASALGCGSMLALFNPEMEYYQENGNFIKLPEWVTYDENAPMDDPLCPLGKQRTLLQWWGTEYRRSVNPDYWVQRLSIIIARENPEVVLISDMRFPNEKAFVEAHGESIRVDRPGLPPLNGAAGVHPSELALANVPDYEWGLILKNDSTLEDFQSKVVRVFDNLMADIPRKMHVKAE